ncbi:hypothetical protein PQX77_008855 [Marasmius sp. AFHP31]|nr:hypothetical protein PQX77_008855 [Marasmius sp. AFHP31]
METSHFVVALLAGGALLWSMKRATRRTGLPPGPPADPLIGHLRIIPTQKTPETFHEWSRIYGDVIYLQFLGREIIVLGTAEAAHKLLDDRGANYSCRPKLTVMELMGWTSMIPFMQYGKEHMKHRRMLQQSFGVKESLSYNPILVDEARHFVKNLVSSTPDTHLRYIHRYATSIITRVAFGHQIKSHDDVLLEIADGIADVLTNCGPPGNTPVDFFPWLARLPSWFPGTHYATVARSYHKNVRKIYDVPLDFLRANMMAGDYEKCFASEKLEELDSSGNPNSTEELETIKSTAAAIFAGGEDTVRARNIDIFLGISFFLAMVHHPECQRRAYEEIISVVGENALPDLKDRESLPYIECIVQEVFRWNPVGPLGVPHRAIDDDIYNGLYIPKGATVIANLRGMSLDEKVYSLPEAFDPVRFLPRPEGRGEPYFASAFGFGRRICPGRHFSPFILWNAIACTLATLEIVPVNDEKGNPQLPELAFSDSLVRSPMPFEFEVRSRSEAAKRLLEQLEL